MFDPRCSIPDGGFLLALRSSAIARPECRNFQIVCLILQCLLLAIGRLKREIGDSLRSRTDETESTEVAIAARALNRMLEFGRPNYIRSS
jgi:hypothetical protein